MKAMSQETNKDDDDEGCEVGQNGDNQLHLKQNRWKAAKKPKSLNGFDTM